MNLAFFRTAAVFLLPCALFLAVSLSSLAYSPGTDNPEGDTHRKTKIEIEGDDVIIYKHKALWTAKFSPPAQANNAEVRVSKKPDYAHVTDVEINTDKGIVSFWVHADGVSEEENDVEVMVTAADGTVGTKTVTLTNAGLNIVTPEGSPVADKVETDPTRCPVIFPADGPLAGSPLPPSATLKLVIETWIGLEKPFKLLFSGGTAFRIYRDAGLTNEIISGTTSLGGYRGQRETITLYIKPLPGESGGEHSIALQAIDYSGTKIMDRVAFCLRPSNLKITKPNGVNLSSISEEDPAACGITAPPNAQAAGNLGNPAKLTILPGGDLDHADYLLSYSSTKFKLFKDPGFVNEIQSGSTVLSSKESSFAFVKPLELDSAVVGTVTLQRYVAGSSLHDFDEVAFTLLPVDLALAGVDGRPVTGDAEDKADQCVLLHVVGGRTPGTDPITGSLTFQPGNAQDKGKYTLISDGPLEFYRDASAATRFIGGHDFLDAKQPATLYVLATASSSGDKIHLRRTEDERTTVPDDVAVSAVSLDLDIKPAGGAWVADNLENDAENCPVIILPLGNGSSGGASLAQAQIAMEAADPAEYSITYNNQHYTLYKDAGLTAAVSSGNTRFTPAQGQVLLYIKPKDNLNLTAPSEQTLTLVRHLNGNSANVDQVKFVLVPVVIKDVRFAGSNYHELKSDDGNTTYNAPHWVDVNGDGIATTNTSSGEKNYPVAFTRNTKPKVGGKFRVAGLQSGQSVKIKVSSAQGLQIPETVVTPDADGIVTLQPQEASNNLINSIQFHNAEDNTAFKIDWEISIGSGGWSSFGSTKHTVYITHADPAPTLSSRQETLFLLACKNAKGKTQVADITDGIWGEFTDRDVRRADKTQLCYYKSYKCSVVTTEELIKQGDGQCKAWTYLFLDLRKVHGIDDEDECRAIQPIPGHGFIVKNWSFNGNGTSNHLEFPYLNKTSGPDWIGDTSYTWMISEVKDVDGIPGQGTIDPASWFNNHLAAIAGDYYDPSYGIKYDSLAEIDDEAVDGYYLQTQMDLNEQVVDLDLNDDGDKDDSAVRTGVMLFKKNPPGLDLIVTPLNY